jgi:multidrug efflux pump subunit AcrA (membrane-fusion protein)
VDETAMASIHPGVPVDIVFRAMPDKKFSGKVTRTSRETDRETREYRVDITPDVLPDNWVLGQRLEVFIHIGKTDNCLAVSNNMICRDKQRTFVLVEEEGRIAERDVKIGIQTRSQTQILSGLTESDRLILHPLQHREHINRRIAR